jgi:hypothetical protein
MSLVLYSSSRFEWYEKYSIFGKSVDDMCQEYRFYIQFLNMFILKWKLFIKIIHRFVYIFAIWSLLASNSIFSSSKRYYFFHIDLMDLILIWCLVHVLCHGPWYTCHQQIFQKYCIFHMPIPYPFGLKIQYKIQSQGKWALFYIPPHDLNEYILDLRWRFTITLLFQLYIMVESLIHKEISCKIKIKQSLLLPLSDMSWIKDLMKFYKGSRSDDLFNKIRAD